MPDPQSPVLRQHFLLLCGSGVQCVGDALGALVGLVLFHAVFKKLAHGPVLVEEVGAFADGGHIEHIGVGLGPGGCIDRKGGGAAGKKEGKLLSPAGTAPVGQAGDRAEGSDKKQQEMPDKAMERQRPVGIHEARRIRQGKDGAQDAEILKKGRQDGSSLRLLYQREDQAEVHGDAAKLEGKVPPVIVKPI